MSTVLLCRCLFPQEIHTFSTKNNATSVDQLLQFIKVKHRGWVKDPIWCKKFGQTTLRIYILKSCVNMCWYVQLLPWISNKKTLTTSTQQEGCLQLQGVWGRVEVSHVEEVKYAPVKVGSWSHLPGFYTSSVASLTLGVQLSSKYLVEQHVKPMDFRVLLPSWGPCYTSGQVRCHESAGFRSWDVVICFWKRTDGVAFDDAVPHSFFNWKALLFQRHKMLNILQHIHIGSESRWRNSRT